MNPPALAPNAVQDFLTLLAFHRQEGALVENNPTSLVIQLIALTLAQLGHEATLMQSRLGYRLVGSGNELHTAPTQALQLATEEGLVLVSMAGCVGKRDVEQMAMFLAAARAQSWHVLPPGWQKVEGVMTQLQLDINLPSVRDWVSKGVAHVAKVRLDGATPSVERAPSRRF